MPLATGALQTAIHAAFKKAKDTPPPADPGQADQAQEQILTQLAQDLSAALADYVKSGDVVGVNVEVRDPSNTVIGSGTQTGPGNIQ